MDEHQGPAERLFIATKRLLASLARTGETRLRLAVLELEEERARLVGLLLLAGISMVLLLLGLAAALLLIIVLFWDTHRLLAIGVAAFILLAGGLGVAWWVLRLARRPTLLRSTLQHLAMDRELLEHRDES